MSYTFDYQSQEITIVAADGVTPIKFRVSDVDIWNLFNVNASISYGAQIGAFGVMLIMTAILTKKNKRNTPVHVLNLLSLFFGLLRALFQALYFTSGWNEFYPYFSNDFSHISSGNYALSMLAIIIPLAFAATVTSSLVLQAYTVTKLMSRKWHLLTSILSTLVLLVALAFRFANVVMNCKAILSVQPYFQYEWLQLSVLATETITIWFFSLIFTGKLAYTVWARKHLGLNSWSYLQILCIMGASTMIIPSIFAIVDYIDVPSFPSIDTWPLAIVALLLPLSALWASMAIDESTSTAGISKLWSYQSHTRCSNCGCNPLAGLNNAIKTPETGIQGADSSEIRATDHEKTVSQADTARDSIEDDFRRMGIQTKDTSLDDNENRL